MNEATWREELAWAAGFFDGDGTIWSYLAKGDPSQPRLGIAIKQNKQEPLVRFQQAVGVGGVYGPTTRFNQSLARLHTYYKWQTTGRKAIAVVGMLWLFLSSPKRHQAHAAVTLYLSNYVKVLS